MDEKSCDYEMYSDEAFSRVRMLPSGCELVSVVEDETKNISPISGDVILYGHCGHTKLKKQHFLNLI